MKTISTLEDAFEISECIRGNCANGHEGTCLYNLDESFPDRRSRSLKPFEIYALKQRIDESDGYSHGGSEWTSNDTIPNEGEYENYDNGDSYLRELFLKNEIKKLEGEINDCN